MKKIIFILLLALFIGCKSKKKVTEREQVKTEISTEVKKVETEVKDVKSDSVVNTSSNTLIITEKKDVELTQGDPNKEIVVIDHTGKKTTYRGANVVLREKSKTKSVKDTSSANLTKTDKSKTDKSETTKTEEKTESKKRTSDSSVKTVPTIIGVGIGLGLIGLIVFWYLRRKKKQLGL